MPETQIRLPRVAKGKRPQFFDDPAIDQMMTFILELSAEVSVLYDRLDTVERLLDANGTISRADVENYRAPEAVENERMARRDGYLKRVFRMHQSSGPAAKAKPAVAAKKSVAKKAKPKKKRR
ncbi:MAG: hypothetical protein SFV19_11955 [Rhodospirillaceae bacterium]|nr:hypothetical protein [Rhodospirillaceae bacterium]